MPKAETRMWRDKKGRWQQGDALAHALSATGFGEEEPSPTLSFSLPPTNLNDDEAFDRALQEAWREERAREERLK